MRRFGLPGFCLAMGLLGATLVGPVRAQVGRDGDGNSGNQPDPAKVKLFPQFKVDGTLEAVVTLLQKDDPNVRIAFHRDPHADPDSPFIRLDLKNVTASDVLNVIGGIYPEVGIRPIVGNAGPIYVVRVAARSTRGPNGEYFDRESGVKVYNLAGPVSGWIQMNMALPVAATELATARKQALDQILSLIQATLAQVSQQSKPVLQVHEATQTLVFRGTTEQHLAVEDALNALPNGLNGLEGASGRGNFSSTVASENNILRAQVAQQAAALQTMRSRLKDAGISGGRGKPLPGTRGGPATTPADQ